MAKRRHKQRRKTRSGKKHPQMRRLPQPSTSDIPEPTVESLLATTHNWTEKMLVEVGAALHRGRKVEPVMEDEAPSDATYDDRAGITYEPITVEADGFLIKAKPRRIGTTEVAKYAKPSCKSCHGLGKWKITGTQSIGRNKNGVKIMQPTEYEANCRCAENEYKAKNKQFLIDSQLGEWIALDDLEIEKVFNVTVEGIVNGTSETVVPQMPEEGDARPECDGGGSLQELPGTSGE